MVLFSASTGSYLRACFFLLLAFQFWKDASVVTEQPLLIVLGQAMDMDHGAINQHNKNVTGLLTLLFGSIGAVDIVQLAANNIRYFDAVVPIRLTFAFIVGGIGYLKQDSILHNDIVFVLSFLEVWFNFSIYNLLRQEKDARDKVNQEKLQREILEAHQDSDKYDELVARIEKSQDI